jgi:hypothetical protein
LSNDCKGTRNWLRWPREQQPHWRIVRRDPNSSQVKSLADAALTGQPEGTSVTLPSDGWYEFPNTTVPNLFKTLSPGNWVPLTTQIIGTRLPYDSAVLSWLTGLLNVSSPDLNNEYDGYLAVGRARVLQPRYKFTITKERESLLSSKLVNRVSQVQFACAVTDLYDFNFEDGSLPALAATVQLGYSNGTIGGGRNLHGRIYRYQIEIGHTYTYPFDYTTTIPSGGT